MVRGAASIVVRGRSKNSSEAVFRFVYGPGIDVNGADLATLEAIPHVDRERLRLIMERRPLECLDDLTAIDGIVPKPLEAIRTSGVVCATGSGRGGGRRLGGRWRGHAAARVPAQGLDRSPERLDEIQRLLVDIRASRNPDEMLPEGFRAVREAVRANRRGQACEKAVHYC